MPEGPIAQEIRARLTQALQPVRLEIEDDSARHAGHHHHGGMDAVAGGESHFNLLVVSQAFEGVGRIGRQRQINRLLADLLIERVHALSIRALTPAEVD